MLELTYYEPFGDKTKEKFLLVFKRSHRPYNFKTSHFTSWKEREWLRNEQKN